MHRNLTTNRFAIAKHDVSFIVRKITAQFFLSIALVSLFQSIAIAENAQADLEKLGSQLIETTYGKLTIIEIDKHPKRNVILDAMTEAQFNDYLSWKSSKAEAAWQEKEKYKAAHEAARQEKEKQKAGYEAAINEIITKSPILLAKYESDIKNGTKLSQKDKELLVYIKNIGKPADIITRIDKILENPRNFELKTP
jgi:hypothetical protein